MIKASATSGRQDATSRSASRSAASSSAARSARSASATAGKVRRWVGRLGLPAGERPEPHGDQPDLGAVQHHTFCRIDHVDVEVGGSAETQRVARYREGAARSPYPTPAKLAEEERGRHRRSARDRQNSAAPSLPTNPEMTESALSRAASHALIQQATRAEAGRLSIPRD